MLYVQLTAFLMDVVRKTEEAVFNLEIILFLIKISLYLMKLCEYCIAL